MSLIRNGGFERGNINFWEVVSDGTLEISNVLPLYGSYCGKFTSTGGGNLRILSSDYIDVKPFEILEGVLYVKSATTQQAYLTMYFYDADYSFIESQNGAYVANDGAYKLLNSQFIIPSGCAYARFGVGISYSFNDEVFYFDGGGLAIIDVDGGMVGIKELLPYTDYTVSGDTSENPKDMKQFSTYYAELFCGNVSGTSPTLDVDVKEGYSYGHTVTLTSFTTITTTGDYRIDIPRCLGKEIFIEYTIGGTSPSFRFAFSIIGKG